MFRFMDWIRWLLSERKLHEPTVAEQIGKERLRPILREQLRKMQGSHAPGEGDG